MGGQPIPALTGLRFFAALAVVVFHFHAGIASLFPPFDALGPITRYGELGVDLFFVLSGFILTYNYVGAFRPEGRLGYVRFLALRLARIYPVHLFTLLVLAVGLALISARGVPVNHPENFAASDFALNALLLHVVANGYRLTWNGPSWSLSAEWIAYLAFPFVTAGLARVGGTFRLLGLAGAALVLQSLVLALIADASPLPRVAGEFLAGCALGHLHLRRPGGDLRWRSVPALVVVGLVLALVVVQPPRVLAMAMAAPAFAVLVYALARQAPFALRLPGGALLVFLGEASYALYMTHGLVALVGDRVLPMAAYAEAAPGVRVLVLLAYGVMLGVAAVGTYQLVERPARTGLRHLLVPATHGLPR